MKRLSVFVVLLGLCAWSGCATAPTPDLAIRQMRLERTTAFGQSRLFSTVGFFFLDEAVRQGVMASYKNGGELDRAALRRVFSKATITEEPGAVSIAIPQSSVAQFYLANGPLISLDPSEDEKVHRLAQDYAHDGKAVPVIQR